MNEIICKFCIINGLYAAYQQQQQKKKRFICMVNWKKKKTQDTWICLETKVSCYSRGLGILSGLKVKILKDYRCIDPLS